MPTPTTTNRGYQKPDAANFLDEDVLRIVSALDAIDSDVAGLLTSVAGKAATGHGHVINDVSGLQAALDGKLSIGATFTLNSLSDVDAASPTGGMFLRYVGTAWVPVVFDGSMVVTGTIAGARLGSHNHAIGDITGLSAALSGKSDNGHGHAQSDITGLTAALASKADDAATTTSLNGKITIPASSARGDLLFRNATEWARLPAGTSGQFLKTNGAGADPAWAAAGAWEKIAETVVSGSPTAITFTNLSAFRALRLTMFHVRFTTDDTPRLEYSTDNGATWDNAWYGNYLRRLDNAANDTIIAQDYGGNNLIPVPLGGLAADGSLMATVELFNFNAAATMSFRVEAAWGDTNGVYTMLYASGLLELNTARNAIKIDGGTFATGTFILEGMR